MDSRHTAAGVVLICEYSPQRTVVAIVGRRVSNSFDNVYSAFTARMIAQLKEGKPFWWLKRFDNLMLDWTI